MEKQNKCPKCDKIVEKEYHFCPYCGEPLTELAQDVAREQTKVAQLKLINLLLDKVKDEKTINLLEKLVKMYK